MPRLAAASLFYLPRSVRATGLGSVPGKKNTEAAKMIIYQCIVTGDEMFSDIYKITESKDGIFYEVEGKHVTRTEGFDESLISANASAEDAVEGTDASSVSGVDIVLNHKLQETAFDKKGYVSYMKDYMKAIKAHLEKNNPERVEKFMADVTPAFKLVLQNFKDLQFFLGESMNPDGMVGLLNYREDGVTPYMLFFKDGLLAEKC